MIMAGAPVFWEGTITTGLRKRLTNLAGSKRVYTDADLDAFLHDIDMPRADYDAGLAHPETQARLHAVNERYARIQAVAGDLRHADPIILVNGHHLVVAHRFRKLVQAFHTANAIIARELESSD